MSEPTSFAEFLPLLVLARLTRGWTRQRLADEIGMKRSTIDSWERSQRTPAAVNAQRWADCLEVQLPADTKGWFAKATRNLVPQHGTRGGAQWHRRQNEEVCRPCLDAESAYARDWRAGRLAA